MRGLLEMTNRSLWIESAGRNNDGSSTNRGPRGDICKTETLTVVNSSGNMSLYQSEIYKIRF